MITLFWNCCGLGSDTIVRALNGLIPKHRPSMIFLSETKMKDHRTNSVRRRMGYLASYNVAPIGTVCGLSLWSDDSVEVEMVDSSRNFIDAHCRVVDSKCAFRFTKVYDTSYKAKMRLSGRE